MSVQNDPKNSSVFYIRICCKLLNKDLQSLLCNNQKMVRNEFLSVWSHTDFKVLLINLTTNKRYRSRRDGVLTLLMTLARVTFEF